jgi:hypothetical protein
MVSGTAWPGLTAEVEGAAMDMLLARVIGGDAPADWMRLAHGPTSEELDEVQNRLLCAIVNAERALESIDGSARPRIEAVLRAAWDASSLIASMPTSPAPARAG